MVVFGGGFSSVDKINKIVWHDRGRKLIFDRSSTATVLPTLKIWRRSVW